MSELKNGELRLSNAKHLPRTVVNGLERFRLTDGDFIFGMSGSLENYAWTNTNGAECYLNQRIGRLKSKEGDKQFLGYLYLSSSIQNKLRALAAGAAQLNVSPIQLTMLRISVPPKAERDRIAAALQAVDKEVATLYRLLAYFKIQKRGLMQKFLTGQIRVKAIEEITA